MTFRFVAAPHPTLRKVAIEGASWRCALGARRTAAARQGRPKPERARQPAVCEAVLWVARNRAR